MINERVVEWVGNASHVLEILAGSNHELISALYDSGKRHVVGLESDLALKTKLAPICDSIFHADLNSNDWPHLLDEREKFDAIVALDVACRLLDPWTNLQRMSALLKQDGCLVLSFPNMGHAAVAAALLKGNFPYSGSGLLSKDYIRFFALKDIRGLLVGASLKVVEMSDVVVSAEKTELAPFWAPLSAEQQSVLGRFERSNVHTVLVKAVPWHHPQPEIDWTAFVKHDAKPDPLQATIDTLGLELANARTRVERLERQLAEKEGALAEMNQTVASILGSTSWKISAPLRGIKKMFN